MTLYIVATNIHTGGGKTLLEALAYALDSSQPAVFFVDSRLTLKLPPYIRIFKFKPSLKERIRSEWLLRQMVKQEDRVICMGNLPPMFKLKARVGVYLQNRYLVEKQSTADFKPFARFRISIERFWLRLFCKNADHFIVQTPSMQLQMQTSLGRSATQLPFHSEVVGFERTLVDDGQPAPKRWDFVYVASGDPHKNHERLINAWVALAAEGLRPSLCLTIDTGKFPDLCRWIEATTAEHHLNISNAGHQPYQTILELYGEAGALIYPSLCETIGLPLIEARCARLAILASELDYVRDVVDPEFTFDPHSVVSIARAVKRFIGIPEEKLPLQNPEAFIPSVLKELGEQQPAVLADAEAESPGARLRWAKFNPKLKFALQWSVSLALIFWLAQKGELSMRNVKLGFANINLVSIFLLLTFCQLLLGAVRTNVLMQFDPRKSRTLFKVLQITWASSFINCIAPSALFGEAYRIKALLTVDPDLNKDNTFYALILSKLLSIFSLVGITVAVSLLVQSHPGEIKWLLYSLYTLCLLCVLGYLFRHWIMSGLQHVWWKTYNLSNSQLVRKRYENFQAYGTIFLEEKKSFLKVLLLSLVIQVLNIASFLVIIFTFNSDISHNLLFLIYVIPIGIFAMMLPVSISGLGVGHVAFSGLLGIVGISNGADIFTLYFAYSYIFNLIGFVPLLSLLRKK